MVAGCLFCTSQDQPRSQALYKHLSPAATLRQCDILKVICTRLGRFHYLFPSMPAVTPSYPADFLPLPACGNGVPGILFHQPRCVNRPQLLSRKFLVLVVICLLALFWQPLSPLSVPSPLAGRSIPVIHPAWKCEHLEKPASPGGSPTISPSANCIDYRLSRSIFANQP